MILLNAVGAGKGSVDSICKRAKTLAEKGHTEDALNLYIKVMIPCNNLIDYKAACV